MAFDAFIKINGIDGESTDDKHQGWIEIQSFGNGHSQTVSKTASSVGGASAERADETIGIDYGKIQWAYTQQKRSGGVAAGNIATGWDLQRNCKA